MADPAQTTVPPAASPLPTNPYLSRQALFPPRIADPPPPGLGLVVVIPCHDEPDPFATLDSLRHGVRSGGAAEVILVVNGSAAADPGVVQRNRATVADFAHWLGQDRDPALAFHLLDCPDLPPRHAGVGLARKIGMDEAVARLHQVGNPRGIIACLDADTRCQPDYLQALENHFFRHPDSPGCTIHFEHPLAGLPPRHRLGMASYELHLRCFRQGLALAGDPYPFHTVGSAMAVRSQAYQRVGGMNRRQAGEDFHFLRKLFAQGGCTELTATTVHPAARVSQRVPFGTGAALGRWLAGHAPCFTTSDPRCYRTLTPLLATPARWMTEPVPLEGPLGDFLVAGGLPGLLPGMRARTTSAATFVKRFRQWFDGLKIVQAVNHLSRTLYPPVPVTDAARTLHRWRFPHQPDPEDDAVDAWLERCRALDRMAEAIRFPDVSRADDRGFGSRSGVW
ncbi:MAG: glycosyltransferase family 2 protein [Magnetococcales bacterium]|nr:glycosyltransferase family 2 protein [Magnetococcales bacterium]